MSRSNEREWSRGKRPWERKCNYRKSKGQVLLTASEMKRRGMASQPHLRAKSNVVAGLNVLTGADGMVTLTASMLDAMSTERGGYTKVTLLALGVEWDDVHHSGLKGWKRALVGQRRPAELVARLVSQAKAVKLFE